MYTKEAAVKGMPDVPEDVVKLFKETYPYAGERLEFTHQHLRGEVLQFRGLLKAFYEGYKACKKEVTT